MSTAARKLLIGGMTCPHCQARVRQALLAVPGVLRAQVSYDRGTADITLDTSSVSDAALRAAIEGAGYRLLDAPERARPLRTAGYLLLMAALFVLLQATGALNYLAPGQLAQSGMGYGMLFAVGLTTSVHCAAMCGGISLSQSLPGTNAHQPNARHALAPALMYNLGRVISYTVTGMILGTLGMLFGAGLNTSLSVLAQALLKGIAGALMLVMGMNLLGLFPALRRLRLRLPRLPKQLRPRGALTVGLLNGLMPCGPLQAMQLAALSSASPVRGALSMLCFSLGTVPLMLGLGSLVSLLGQRFRRAVTAGGAVLVAVMGLSMISQGAALAGMLPAAAQPGVQAQSEAGVQVVRSTLLPNSYPNITVQAGVPVRWEIDAPEGSINGCNNRFLIPALNIEYTFHTGKNVIAFTPEQAGTLSYTCWMGMIRGAITVQDGTADPLTDG